MILEIFTINGFQKISEFSGGIYSYKYLPDIFQNLFTQLFCEDKCIKTDDTLYSL
jgi:hypothetical protein